MAASNRIGGNMQTAETDLSIFCKAEIDDRGRHRMRSPCTHGGWTYATDGRLIVRIPAPESIDVPRPDYFPGADEIMKNFDPSLCTTPFPDITTETKQVVCPHCPPGKCKKCDGDGELECWHCGFTNECKECEGTGETDYSGDCKVCNNTREVPVTADMEVCGGVYDGRYLQRFFDKFTNMKVGRKGGGAYELLQLIDDKGMQGIISPISSSETRNGE